MALPLSLRVVHHCVCGRLNCPWLVLLRSTVHLSVRGHGHDAGAASASGAGCAESAAHIRGIGTRAQWDPGCNNSFVKTHCMPVLNRTQTRARTKQPTVHRGEKGDLELSRGNDHVNAHGGSAAGLNTGRDNLNHGVAHVYYGDTWLLSKYLARQSNYLAQQFEYLGGACTR